MITVFFDGACGLCSKEINYYRRIAPEGVFDWQDITISTEALTKEGISLVDGLMQLHAKDDAGDLHVGVDAFVLMWRNIGAWRYLAYLVALPGVKQVTSIAYRYFCKWRFRRLSHC